MNEQILDATANLEMLIDRLWQRRELKNEDLNSLFKIHRLLKKLDEEGEDVLRPRAHNERRNAIDLGDRRNVISR